MLRLAFVSFVIVGVIGLTGCGVSPDDSKKLWRSIESSLGHNPTASKQQALSVGIDFNVDCADGGTASLQASLDVTNPTTDAVNALFGYDVSYDRCKPDENTLDGDLKYSATLVAGSSDTGAALDEQTVYRGSVTSTGDTNGTCDVDVVGHIQAAIGQGPGDEFDSGVNVVYSGTICGHDASQVLNVDEKVTASSAP